MNSEVSQLTQPTSSSPPSPLDRPIFSLVMATVNRSVELERMLNSLSVQTENRFELIVIDQNEDDRVAPLLEPMRRLGFRVVHQKLSPPNLSRARNVGLEMATGSVVGFPDDDCWYESDCLEVMAAKFNELADADGIIARWVELHGPGPHLTRQLEYEHWRRFRDGDASSITIFVRTDALLDVDGFDTRLGVGQFYGAGEDTDLVFRLLARGRKLVYEPSVLVHHLVNDTVPSLTLKEVLSCRQRARGAGAIYVKFKLSIWTIARGLLAPIPKAIASRQPFSQFVFAIPMVIGRLEGMLHWWLRKPAEGPKLQEARSTR